MADQLQTTPEIPLQVEPHVATLLAGILSDLQALVSQQMRLTRQEIATNLRLRAAATLVVAAGLGLGMIATLLLSLSLVHALHRSTSPQGAELAWLSLAACYGIVSAVLWVLSSGLVCLGRFKFQSIPAWENLADDILVETRR